MFSVGSRSFLICFFGFPFVLFDGYTITDKNDIVNTKFEK